VLGVLLGLVGAVLVVGGVVQGVVFGVVGGTKTP
jgi:hypothetical protein